MLSGLPGGGGGARRELRGRPTPSSHLDHLRCAELYPCYPPRHSGLFRARTRHLGQRVSAVGRTERAGVAAPDGTTHRGVVEHSMGECRHSDRSSSCFPRLRRRSGPQFKAGSHVMQDRARFTSILSARASFLAASSSSGISPPVPKYISSGVWPLNAERGSTPL